MPESGLIRGYVQEYESFYFPEKPTSVDIELAIKWIAKRSLISEDQTVENRVDRLLMSTSFRYGDETLAIQDDYLRLMVTKASVILFAEGSETFRVVPEEDLGSVGFVVGPQVELANGSVVPQACVDALARLGEEWPGSTLATARAAIANAVIRTYKGEPLDD